MISVGLPGPAGAPWPALLASMNVNDNSAAGKPDGLRSSKSLEGRAILLVEDEMLLAMDLQFMLEDAGAKVVGPYARVTDAEAAARDESLHFDAAILDVDLHGYEVYPAAEALMDRGIPFLFHTGHGDPDALAQRFANAPTLIKPTMHRDVLAVLTGLLG